MKLGLCCASDQITQAAELGFDYIEVNLANLASMPQADYDALLASARPIPISRCNCFFPGDVRPVGPDVSEKVLRTYLETAFSRASRLGVKVVVFGSGAARRAPEGWAISRAWKQLADFLHLASEYGERYDITIALEPLNRRECNLLNLVSEATLLASLVHHPRIKVLGDTFHMKASHEPMEALANAGELLAHVHLSHTLPDLSGRIFPEVGDGEDYAEIVQILKDMHYPGDLSIEAGGCDWGDKARAVVSRLKSLL